MKTRKVLPCFALLFFLQTIAHAQVQKEVTSVKVETKEDLIINYKKTHKSITHGSVCGIDGNSHFSKGEKR